MKRAPLVAILTIFLFHLGDAAVVAQAPQPLDYFKTFFLTGDYVIAGVGLHDTGSGAITIPPGAVPAGKDVVAAFLYWQVLTSPVTPNAGGVGAHFKGHPLSSPDGIFAKGLGPGTPACGAITKRAFTYRMDVLRYFDVDESPGPNFGKLVLNGTHTVQLPISGFVEPMGASLVVMYRDESEPLRAVVIYDGAFAMDQATNGLQLTMKGIYDGKPGPAMLSLIGGNGAAGLNEITRFNEPPLADGTPLATNAFSSSLGAKWDNPTFDADDGIVTPAPPSGSVTDQVTVSVSKENLTVFDCVTFAAAIYSTAVEDRDGDGLLDRWEETSTPLFDPHGQPLLMDANGQPTTLAALGADPDVPDVFVEIGYMQTGPAAGPLSDYSYGGVVKPAHSHRPGHEALKLVGDAFKGSGPTDRIRIHFDVGPNYPLGHPTDPRLNAEEYLVPRGQARGGYVLDEAVTLCERAPTDPEYICQFGYEAPATSGSGFPGTVGWKTGYRFFRDEVFSITPALPSPLPPGETADDYCGTLVAGSMTGQRYVCQRRFDENRFNIFRYTLYAHHVGLPKSEFACLLAGVPVHPNAEDMCVLPAVPNPLFHVPTTSSGIGDFPGADSMVTLGNFLDVSGLPIGTPFMQGGTAMHEYGHNFLRRHGGGAFEPNCKPTYLSVMNYLYQLRGLKDDGDVPHLDYSGAIGPTVNEAGLNANVDSPTYRLGWFAPLSTSYLAGRASGVERHCNGSERLPGEVDMVRVDAPVSGQDIDWDADGIIATVASTQDVNYSGGPFTDALAGSDDWSNLALNQTGVRRNVGALFFDPTTLLFTVGPTSIGLGKGDAGKGDAGVRDLGKGDAGKGDAGKGDAGKGDAGKGDAGKGDAGKGDAGGGDLFLNDPGNPFGEIDAETAAALNRAPPNAFQACVSGVDCGSSTAPLHDVQISFEAPNVVGVATYTVYRALGTTLTPGLTWVTVATIPHVLGVREYSATDDNANLVNGQQYVYFAVSNFTDGGTSDLTRRDVITAVVPSALFAGVLNTPPRKVVLAGTLLPMAWRYTINGATVGSALVAQRVTVTGGTVNETYSCTNQTGSTPCTDPGSSFFSYDATFRRWFFNLQTRNAAGQPWVPGVYTVTITPLTPGFLGATFQITVQ